MTSNKCTESGQVYLNKPWWARKEERFQSGFRVTCSCGKIVKLRTPMNGGVCYNMVPHHNVLERSS